MRVALIHVPRTAVTIGDAMRMTKWSLVTSNFFFSQLNDIAEQSTEPFSLELRLKSGPKLICKTRVDSIIGSLFKVEKPRIC
jgi:hypothetical protein